VADNAPFLKEYNKFTSSRSLGALELDDEPTMGYTYKCLGAALFSLKNATSWLTGITRLVMEAGDADTYVTARYWRKMSCLTRNIGYQELRSRWSPTRSSLWAEWYSTAAPGRPPATQAMVRQKGR
jgi:hypothetical protein